MLTYLAILLSFITFAACYSLVRASQTASDRLIDLLLGAAFLIAAVWCWRQVLGVA